MLAVPRTAKPLSWHGKQLAEMQHGASRAPMEARRDGGAQRPDAYASPRSPAEFPPCNVGCPRQPAGSPPCDAECGRLETLGGVGLCTAVNCPLRETYLRPGPACEKAAEQHAAQSENYDEGKTVHAMQFVVQNHLPK